MSTPVREGGFKVRVLAPPREHGPPHVHVVRHRGEVLIELDPLSIKEVRGRIKDADIVKAFRIVEAHVDVLLAEWRRIHGR
jgi:hypothetical protein